MPDKSKLQDSPRVGVIGASGQTGLTVLRALADRGVNATALIHRDSGREAVESAGAGRAELIDLEVVDTVTSALSGIDVVYAIPPAFKPNEHELMVNAIRAAEAADVDRFVFHSVLHPWTPGLIHHQRKAATEAVLRDSSLSWTILQPAMFAQTALLFLRGAEGRIPFSPEASFTVIDLADIAEAAAIVLLDESHAFATYELAGAERLTIGEIVLEAARARGLEVTITEVKPWEAAPPFWTSHEFTAAAAMFAHYGDHGLLGNSSVASWLLGRTPTSVADAFSRE